VGKFNASTIIEKYSRVIILPLIVLVLALMRPHAFWTWNNLSTVMFQQAPFTMLMSFGMTLAIITKGIDKSMGSVLVLSSVIAAGFIKKEQLVLGIVVALVIGGICGLINGLLITKLGLFPFIATYGIDFMALGLAYVYTGGVSIYGFSQAFRNMSTANFHGITSLAVITGVIFLLLYVATTKTTFGRRMYGAGFNAKATELSGNNVARTITVVYIINGLIAAITGILYMARLNAADPGISGNFTLDSIAAALIGGTSFGGGKGSVSNAVVGSLIIVFIRNGMNIMGVETTWQQTVVGFIILLSILLEALTRRLVSLPARNLGKRAAETAQ
jgi:ribose transport system permease protein